MSNQPLISVIMPAYNAEKTIRESIQSVIEQTYQNWELLVVNDGSKDNTSEVVKKFQDSRIILIEQENAGVAEARNNGIKHVNGEYIAFLDSDDLWNKEKLTIQIEYLNHNSDIGLVYTDKKCFLYNSSELFDCTYTEFIDEENDYLRLIIYNYISTLTVIVRKEVLDKVGLFDSELFGTEDWDLWIRIAKEYKIAHVKKVLAYYREHSAGISKQLDRHLNEEKKVIDKHTKNLPINQLSIVKLSLWVWTKRKLKYILKKREFLNAFMIMIVLVKLRPSFKIYMKLLFKAIKS